MGYSLYLNAEKNNLVVLESFMGKPDFKSAYILKSSSYHYDYTPNIRDETTKAPISIMNEWKDFLTSALFILKNFPEKKEILNFTSDNLETTIESVKYDLECIEKYIKIAEFLKSMNINVYCTEG